MNCKHYEEKILEVLDGEKLSPAILSHINKCKSCFSFHKYILTLEENFNKIEKLELPLDFDEKIIEKLKIQPSYWKVFTLISSLVIFIPFLFVSLIVQRYFVQITVFFGKILKIFEILSGTFSYSFYTVATLSFLSVFFLVILSGAFDVFLLSKLIKNGGKL